MHHNTHKSEDEAVAAGRQELELLLTHFPKSLEYGTTDIQPRYDSELAGWVVRTCWFAKQDWIRRGLESLMLRQMPSGTYDVVAQVHGLPYTVCCDDPLEAVLVLQADLLAAARRHEIVHAQLKEVSELFVLPDDEPEPATQGDQTT